MPRDPATLHDSETTAAEGEEKLFCARCGRLVTMGRWRIAMNDDHEHVVFNPAGAVFRIFCFREAPGAVAAGAATAAFTWFKPYAWRLAMCGGCGGHLGWRYEGADAPRIFFAIIGEAITANGG